MSPARAGQAVQLVLMSDPVVPVGHRYLHVCEDCGRFDPRGSHGPAVLWGTAGAYTSICDQWLCAPHSETAWAAHRATAHRAIARRAELAQYAEGTHPLSPARPAWWPDGLPTPAISAAA